MDFVTERAATLARQVREFVDTRVIPVEAEIFAENAAKGGLARADGPAGPGTAFALDPRIEELKTQAREAGLWNLFLPRGHEDAYPAELAPAGGPLSNLDYAAVAEQTGRSFLAPLVMNTNAPDTGNMEVLLTHGSREQQDTWLVPLLEGRIRSAFLMTEPDVASSDASNMAATAVIDGDEVVLNGTKWWSSGAGHPQCEVGIFMGVTDPEADRRARHSMVLVPMSAPGVKVERMLSAMGHYDEPLGHGEVSLTDVRLSLDHIINGPGKASQIAQDRLGPGRVHHCMRLIGLAERALELAIARSTSRTAFGRPIAELGGNRERLAKARIEINAARLLVLDCAFKLDRDGVAGALSEVSEIKAHVPRVACEVIDMAIQLHGGAGVSADTPLAAAYAGARSLRLADGPDEVHLGVVARRMLKGAR